MLIAGSWANNFDSETDWNMITPPMKGVNNRQVKLSRGRFLSGCSGCNGTLCIRGCKQDFDDWGLAGWSGEEFFHYMRKVSHHHHYPMYRCMDIDELHRLRPSTPSPGSRPTPPATATPAPYTPNRTTSPPSRNT